MVMFIVFHFFKICFKKSCVENLKIKPLVDKYDIIN